ncbi:MAG: hypothetical protein J6A05_05295, partial [Oscillospiraceae bacterium]|nr:hypothetical protein [Oscillospiraceae bacterium]
IYHGTGENTVYVSGTGKIQICAKYDAFSPFNSGSKGGGNGGSTSEGGMVSGTVDYPVLALNLYGKSVQNGTPTLETPVDIVSVGDDGTVVITVDNGSDISLSATITSGLPLCSGIDVRDELVYNADGTGKIIKNTGFVLLDGSDDENWQIMYDCFFWGGSADGLLSPPAISTVGIKGYWEIGNGSYGLALAYGVRLNFANMNAQNNTVDELKTYLAANPITVIYNLTTPYEINLTAAEMAELMQLQTFDGVTNVYNDENAEMKVKVATNPLLAEYVKPIIDGISKRYEARIAALEAAVTNT